MRNLGFFGSIYGESPSLWTIKDSEIPSKWVIVKGWMCTENPYKVMVFGTAIRRGPIDDETEPQDIIDENCVYIVAIEKHVDGHVRLVKYFEERSFYDYSGHPMIDGDKEFWED